MKIVELGEVCEVIAGQSPPSSTYNVDGIGLPFFQGRADFQEKYPQVRNWCSEPKKISEPFDILFSVRAPVGSVNINNVTACIGRGIAAIRCGDKINLDYLFHFLRSQEKKIADLGTGSTFKAITIRVLRSIKIPLPPLPVQEKIASILDDAAALRDKTEQLLIEYDLLAQSIFLEMFGDPLNNTRKWKKFAINELGVVTTGSTPPSKLDNMFDGPIPFVTPGDLDSDEEYKRTVTEEGAKSSRMVGKNALLVCCIGATIGKRRRVKENVAFNQQINAIEWNEKINPIFGDYVFDWVKFEVVNRAILTTLPILKKSLFEQIECIVPPLDLQNQFAEKIQLIERQKEIVRQELKESKDLFQALLQQAFRGELM